MSRVMTFDINKANANAHNVMSVLRDIETVLNVLEDSLFEEQDEETLESIAFLKVKDDVEKAIDLVLEVKIETDFPAPEDIENIEYDEWDDVIKLTLFAESEEDPNEIEA